MGISATMGWMTIVLATGCTALLISKERFRPGLALVIVLINSIFSSILSIESITSGVQTGTFTLSNIAGDILLRIDSLSAWFILIINFTSLTGVIYGTGYLKSYSHLKVNSELHWIFYVLFHISMIWVCMFENGLGFLVSWELMSLSSLMLVIFEFQNKRILKAGINYMVQMHLSVVLLTSGFIWLYVQTGSLDFGALAETASYKNSIWIFILLIAGFAIKAGFIPFHTWLPHAHPAAPSHVSGVMSAVIVKMGIYGIFRVIMNLRQDWMLLGEIFLGFSIVTAVYGIANSTVKHDFKRMLAYCTIENIGIIGIGTGIGLIGMGTGNTLMTVLGFSGALLHTLNHSLYKSMLFYTAGNIYQQTHTRNIERLGGLIKKMPKTAGFFLMGSLSIGGMPPFNGFISKFIIYFGLFTGLINFHGIFQAVLLVSSIIGLALAGGMSLLTFTKTFGVIFLGKPREEIILKPKEAAFIMLLPQYIITAVMFSIAFYPQFYLEYAGQVIKEIFSVSMMSVNLPLISGIIGKIGIISIIFIFIMLLLFALRYFFVRNGFSGSDETWGCGFTVSVAKAQYTGRSYIRSFGQLFSFLVKENKKGIKIQKGELYPFVSRYSATYIDILEKFIIVPVSRRLSFGLNYFQFIQNGLIQSYVLYGLFFILIVFLGSVFNLFE